MKKISILGCGWLGLPLGEYLVEKGFAVKGSTTREARLPAIKAVGIEPFLLKIDDQLIGKNWDDFLSSDTLILNIPPGRRTPDVATRHPRQIEQFLKLVRQSAIQSIVFVSSVGVYGNERQVVTEETPLNPSRDSGKALVKVEALIQAQPNLQVTILRMGGLVGGERKAGRFLANKTAVPNGDARINMVHLADCIEVIYQVLKQDCWGEILNVCADEHPTREEFYTYQAEKEGLTPPTFLPTDGLTAEKVVSNQKLKQQLNYTFLHPDPMRF